MNRIVAEHPGKEIHVILDNLSTHKPKRDRWLARHPNVRFHFTPTYSSWLNQIEIWSSILQGCSISRRPRATAVGRHRCCRELGDVSDQYSGASCARTDLAARKSWCESDDPDFVAKAAEIVGLYLNPPQDAVVLAVDEKPQIQALERAQGYLKLPNGAATITRMRLPISAV